MTLPSESGGQQHTHTHTHTHGMAYPTAFCVNEGIKGEGGRERGKEGGREEEERRTPQLKAQEFPSDLYIPAHMKIYSNNA